MCKCVLYCCLSSSPGFYMTCMFVQKCPHTCCYACPTWVSSRRSTPASLCFAWASMSESELKALLTQWRHCFRDDPLTLNCRIAFFLPFRCIQGVTVYVLLCDFSVTSLVTKKGTWTFQQTLVFIYFFFTSSQWWMLWWPFSSFNCEMERLRWQFVFQFLVGLSKGKLDNYPDS